MRVSTQDIASSVPIDITFMNPSAMRWGNGNGNGNADADAAAGEREKKGGKRRHTGGRKRGGWGTEAYLRYTKIEHGGCQAARLVPLAGQVVVLAGCLVLP